MLSVLLYPQYGFALNALSICTSSEANGLSTNGTDFRAIVSAPVVDAIKLALIRGQSFPVLGNVYEIFLIVVVY